MASHQVVVIGASAGGVESLMQLAASFPADFPLPILVVQHVSPRATSTLPQILQRSGPLAASHAVDGQRVMPGHIYVAVPDHHLLIEDGHLIVARGPKENRFRPSANALFRSAAYAYGPGVIAVVLSGMLDDGASGLWTVKRRGGVAVVQDPADAMFDEMPRNALGQVNVDHVVPLSGLAPLLTRLAQDPAAQVEENHMSDNEEQRLATEVQVTAGQRLPLSEWLKLGEPSTLTCPECHGALLKVQEGMLTRYRCHTGHAFSDNGLLSYVTENIEESLWNALRAIDESQMLLRHMAEHYADLGDPQTAEAFLDRAQEAQDRASQIRALVVQRSAQGRTPDHAQNLTTEDVHSG
ncbi:chemotaxis protein CheB [Deinococcus deserti]|uniref:protein-glutamate methylesterase n=1 Tax=Deinococcus deserti (strain DSM 17065 / CIP 109153 / LMG 22923 / VCD115) TaxID=546414 RepID=C1CZ46_DEIDV|nr:chemotaxis protein CheB [Deinococcus deserti]ACO45084.1 putative CheB methylesterase [Deinococcus deserti VCD115]